MDDKKASYVLIRHQFDGYNRECWPEMIEWLVNHVPKMEATFKAEIPALRRALG